MLQSSMTQLVSQITQSVREIHLVVTWKDGKNNEQLEVVTHIVSTGPGSDRTLPTTATIPGAPGATTGTTGTTTGTTPTTGTTGTTQNLLGGTSL